MLLYTFYITYLLNLGSQWRSYKSIMFPVEIKPNISTIYGVCNLGGGCKSHLKRNVERIDHHPLMNYIPNLKGNK